MNLQDLAQQAIKKSLKKGAEAAEIYLENGRNLIIEVRNDEVERIQEAGSYGAGLRLIIKGRMAFASTNDLREKAIEEAINRAIEFARITTADPANVLPDDPKVSQVEGLYDPEISRISMDEKIALLQRLEKLAMKDPRITKSDGATYREGEAKLFWPILMVS